MDGGDLCQPCCWIGADGVITSPICPGGRWFDPLLSLPFLLFAFVTTLLNHIQLEPVTENEGAA